MYNSNCSEIVDNAVFLRLIVERGADLEGLGIQTRALVNSILERMPRETTGRIENDHVSDIGC